MKKLLLLSVMVAGVFTSGCVPVLIGAGVATGYAISNDAATGNLYTTYNNLWNVSLRVLRQMESVEFIEANESKGLIKVDIFEMQVTVQIDTISSKEQKLRVSARKYLLPKPQYAQKIFLKIARALDD